MAPTRYPLPLLLLLLATAAPAATATDTADAPPLAPTPWPDRFHALLFTNLTNYSMASTGPPLRLTDLYYDWPRRRNLNLVRHQLSADPLYDVKWNNGTTFYFDSASCRVEQFPVGVLPPWWLSGGGAEYMGREITGGIDCHLWAKAGFIFYYEEVATGRPVRWDFVDVTGIIQYVMSYDVGVTLEDSQWQAPAQCFQSDDEDSQWQAPAQCFQSDDENSAEGRLVKRNAEKEEVVDGLEAARLLKKLAVAGAAAAF